MSDPKALTGIHALIGAREAVFVFVETLNLPIGVARVWPEIGVHPYDIHDLVITLRRQTPCLIITLSPLVINELDGDEVSVVTRDADGKIVVTPLHRTKNWFDRRKVYENGELWLAHPDIEGRPDVR